MSGGLAACPVGELLDLFAAPTPSPGGGSAAALAAATAAALVERCARVADRPDAARAAELRAELLALVDRDAAVLAALASAPGRAAAADVASGPPVALRAAAAEVATLAGALERTGVPAYRGEACCARLLAEAAASIAGRIVSLNEALAERQG